MTTADNRPTSDLPTPSALIAGLADGSLAIGTLAEFEVAEIVHELMRRNAELEAERDALLRHCVRRGRDDAEWFAMDGCGGHVLVNVGWSERRTREGAVAAVRKAVGIDDKVKE